MRSVNLMSLIACVGQAHPAKVALSAVSPRNNSQLFLDAFVDKMVDKLANKLWDRVREAQSYHPGEALQGGRVLPMLGRCYKEINENELTDRLIDQARKASLRHNADLHLDRSTLGKPPAEETTDAIGLDDLSLGTKKKKKKEKSEQEEGMLGKANDEVENICNGVEGLGLSSKKKKKEKKKEGDVESAKEAPVVQPIKGKVYYEKVDPNDKSWMDEFWEKPPAGSNFESYVQLLDETRGYLKELGILDENGDPHPQRRYTLKPPLVERLSSKKKVSWSNFVQIAEQMKRKPDHLKAYVLNELGTDGTLPEDGSLHIKGRYTSANIENVLRKYIKAYVTCPSCSSGNTTLFRHHDEVFTDLKEEHLSCGGCRNHFKVAKIEKKKVE